MLQLARRHPLFFLMWDWTVGLSRVKKCRFRLVSGCSAWGLDVSEMWVCDMRLRFQSGVLLPRGLSHLGLRSVCHETFPLVSREWKNGSNSSYTVDGQNPA